MTFIRSTIYNIFFFTWTTILSVLGVVTFVSYPLTIKWMQFWMWGLLFGAKIICGIRYKVEGMENIPDDKNGFIIASKHQSAWDTLIFHHIFGDPVYVLKKGLRQIPFFGWYHIFSRNIAIDRKGGRNALKSLVVQSKDRLNKGRAIVIFPEGTRVSAGESGTYHSGVYAIYSSTSATVIPVALNSGMLWGKNSYIKKSGVITLKFLPTIQDGLKRSEFMKILENTIEDETSKLCKKS